jgi:hypothetical protein
MRTHRTHSLQTDRQTQASDCQKSVGCSAFRHTRKFVSSNLGGDGGGEPLFTLILCLKLWGYLFTRACRPPGLEFYCCAAQRSAYQCDENLKLGGKRLIVEFVLCFQKMWISPNNCFLEFTRKSRPEVDNYNLRRKDISLSMRR